MGMMRLVTVVVFTLSVVMVTVMMGKYSVCIFGRKSWESRNGGKLVHSLEHLLRRVLAKTERVGREEESQQNKNQQIFMCRQTIKQAVNAPTSKIWCNLSDAALSCQGACFKRSLFQEALL